MMLSRQHVRSVSGHDHPSTALVSMVLDRRQTDKLDRVLSTDWVVGTGY